ncbi:MAG: hypothetical protein KDA32_12915 [Phycisphaerales bacterium]|nr:hypothetical protein [Phycisphaerales bacterium]
MNDKILDKYAGRVAAAGDAPEGEDAEDYGAFGFLRGVRDRAPMLELRKRDGNILALGYNWIERLEFNPSDGILIHAGGKAFAIRGRNLNAETRPNLRLFQGLTRHRVPWLRETDQAEWADPGENRPIIERIEW